MRIIFSTLELMSTRPRAINIEEDCDDVVRIVLPHLHYPKERVTAVSPLIDPSSAAAPPLASSLLSYLGSKSASAWIDSPVFFNESINNKPS
ncbi:unnamed protein product [Rotaria socialis]